MTWSKKTLLVVALVFIFTLMGCYTVVALREKSVYRVETEDYILEEEDYEDVVEGDEEVSTVIHEHHIYGDLWGGYMGFDPYWGSPYGWRYSFWNYYDYWWSPWSSWYGGYGYNPYYSGYYGGYYGNYYYDPYWTYYNGYYSVNPGKRRPFDRRTAHHRRDDYAPASSSVSGDRRMSKPSGTEDPRTGNRVSKDNTERSRVAKGSESSDRPGITTQRVRKSSSEQTTNRSSTSTRVSNSNRGRKASSSSATVRRPSTRKSSSSRVRKSSSSGRGSSYRPSSTRSTSSGASSSASSSRSSSSGKSSSSSGSSSRSGKGSRTRKK